jgi:hypothetical protein
MRPKDKANRFDDLAVGDKVRPRDFSSVLPTAEYEVLHLENDFGHITVRDTGYKAKHTQYEVDRAKMTFACHNEGAPFTSSTDSAETGYADGFKTGYNWNRKRWAHTPGGPHRMSPSHNECRHLRAAREDSEANAIAWHKGFTAGEAARKKLPIDPKLPLELDTGEQVTVISISEYHVTVELPANAVYAASRSGRYVSAHLKSAVLTHNHAFYLRNTKTMPLVTSVEYRLISGAHTDCRRFESFETANNAYHESDGSYSILEVSLGHLKNDGLIVPLSTRIVPPQPLVVRKRYRYSMITNSIVETTSRSELDGPFIEVSIRVGTNERPEMKIL